MNQPPSPWFAYHALSRCLRHPAVLASAAHDWGLSAAQLQAFRSVAWLPRQAGKTRSALHLGFADGAPLPRHVRLPDGASLPVHAVRTRAGTLHGARIGNAVRDSGTGTLTALIRERNNQRLYALTAGHVLAAADDTAVGDRVTLWKESALYDAVLDHWMPGFHNGPRETRVDAGLARISAAQASALVEQEDLLLPKGVVGINLQRTLTVETCSDSGTVPAWPQGFVSAKMEFEDTPGALGYQILDAMLFTTPGPILKAGDSGSPVMEEDRLAGMYIGSAPTGLVDAEWAGLVVPMVRILDWCNAELVLDLAAPHPAARTAAPQSLPDSSPELTLARTIWGEARSEGRDGMAAVANVVMNRVNKPRYWGRSVVEVCRKPYQFSCWNSGDPNSIQLQKLSEADLAQQLPLARSAIAMQLQDATNGATHYHVRGMAKPPRWAEHHQPCAVIGNHAFYNDIA